MSSPIQGDDKANTLLVVFSHPDDETVVSPILARYAREGVTVHLAIATDGQKGVREHAGIPSGAKLAAARAEEARCACRELGIQPPILMGIEDGAMGETGNKAALVREISRLFRELEPDVVVTWGPDGVSGHTDHRLVSSVVTEVYQGEEAPPRQLYYVGLSAERLAGLTKKAGSGEGMPMEVLGVRDRYLPVRVSYEVRDAEAAARALACHTSQFTPEEMARLGGMARRVENGSIALRPWFVDPGPSTDLFE